MDSKNESEQDEIARLVTACLDDYVAGGLDAVQGFLDAHPKHADKLRQSLQALAEFGLLEGSEQTPQSFGPYAILGLLGRGGMSEVFLAYDPRMKREIALKCAHPGLALEARTQKRFQREVEAVAKLTHPGIVPVFDSGEADGRAYFTMEYARGSTLSSLVKQLIANSKSGQQSPAEVIAEAVEASDPNNHVWQRPYVEIACRWILELAEALAHAHAAGVIHRDVTPANIIVRQNGHAQLFDFGLAMLQDAPSLTMFGEFTGTPYYVSPEQLRGETGAREDLDERCDVYSLGVTLFELITLRRPFEGKSTAEVLNRIQNSEVQSPRQFNPQIPRDLELICLTALDRDRNRRYPSMQAFAADLGAFLRFEPVAARPIGKAERTWRFIKRRPAVAATLALSAVLFIGMPPILLGMNATIRRERDAANDSAQQATDFAKQATDAAEVANQSAEHANQSAHRATRIAEEFEEFLLGLFDGERLGTPNMTIEQLVTRGVERLSRAGADESEQIELALLEASGRVFSQIGQNQRAQEQLREVYLRKQEITDTSPDELAKAAMNYSATLLNTKQGNQSHGILTTALERLTPTAKNATLRAKILMALATADLDQDNLQGASVHLDTALAVSERHLGNTPEQSIHMWLRESSLADSLGRHDLIQETLEQALQLLGEQWEANPTQRNSIHESLIHLATHIDINPTRLNHYARQSQRALDRAQRWKATLSTPPIPLPIETAPKWQEPYYNSFNQALSALSRSQDEQALALFRLALDLNPNGSLAAYNMYCAAINSGRNEEALEALQVSLKQGFGLTPRLRQFTREGPDFDRAMRLPAFATSLAQLDAIIASPLPTQTFAASEPQALLVYVTPTKSKPEQTAKLRSIATRLNWTLIIVSPSSPGEPNNLSWITQQGLFEYEVQRSTDDLTAALRPQLNLHWPATIRSHLPVILTSAADSGPLATHFAIAYPGLVDALVLLDSFPGPEQRTSSMQDAAISGLTITVVDEPKVDAAWIAEGISQDEFASAVATWFESMAFDTRLFKSEDSENLESVYAAVVDRVRALKE